MPKSMFDIIKKQNGEHFAKAIRNYDNGIFDIPNIDKIVKYAGRDAEPIMNYLVSLKNIQIEEMSVHRDPIDLLDMAGYDAYVADTLEKQNAIKKYYAPGEELCTFHDPHRFKEYYIINAVRKDVDRIKRSEKPRREDEYGTSVISIQVLKSGGFISIKNRYNHTVENPDNTLNSNPDNIIPGLGDAIKHYFNVDFSAQNVGLFGKYVLMNKQICQYNQEINNVYLGKDFYAVDGIVHELDHHNEIMLGNGLVLNLKIQTVKSIIGDYYVSLYEQIYKDFADSIENAIRGKKIQLKKGENETKSLFVDGEHFLDTKNGMLTFINPQHVTNLFLNNLSLQNKQFDFKNSDQVILRDTNLPKDATIIINQNVKNLVLADPITLQGNQDFSNADNLELRWIKFDNATNVKFNSAASDIRLYDIWLPDDTDPDFSNVKNLSLQYVRLPIKNKLKFNINAESIYLKNTHIPENYEFLNFSGVKKLTLLNLQIPEKCTIKFNPHAGEVFIGAVENLRGDLDFSHVRKLEFIDTDLSHVTSIKFNPNGEIRGLKPKDKLRFALINGTQKIKQGLSKVKQRVIKNDTRTM